jgi:hypothetical protein
MFRKIFFYSYFFLVFHQKNHKFYKKVNIARRIRGKVNAIVLLYIGKNIKPGNSNNDLVVLDYINKLILDHCSGRDKFFKFSKRYPQIFIFLSFTNLIYFNLRYFSTNFLIGLFPYNFPTLNSLSDKVFSINFSSHHYSYKDISLDQKSINSSLGSFLSSIGKNIEFFSISENIRKSKSFESVDNSSQPHLGSLKRTVLRRNLALNFNLIKNLKILIEISVQEIMLYVFEHRSLMQFLSKLALRHSAVNFYPFARILGGKNYFFYKAYDWSIKYKLMLAGINSDVITCVSYSSNILESEDFRLVLDQSLFRKYHSLSLESLFNLSVYLTDQNSYGYHYYDKLIEIARSQADSKYGTELSRLNGVEKISEPIQLGFEGFYSGDSECDVVIFDIPPVSSSEESSISFSGCPCSTIEYYSLVMGQILSVTSKLGLKCGLKVKYSFQNYTSEFRLYLKELEASGLIIFSPYVEKFELITKTSLCISFPVTGTYQYAKYCGVDSIVYFPTLDYNGHRDLINGDYIFGQISLETFIRNRRVC